MWRLLWGLKCTKFTYSVKWNMALIFRKRDDLRFKSICEIWNVQNSVVNERLAADRHFPEDWAIPGNWLMRETVCTPSWLDTEIFDHLWERAGLEKIFSRIERERRTVHRQSCSAPFLWKAGCGDWRPSISQKTKTQRWYSFTME